MRLVDAHTHFYPDDLAVSITRSLHRDGMFEACCDGTSRDLRRFMNLDGVDVSVNLPVATKKEQVRGINRKMIGFNRGSPGDVLCFGSMHPDFGGAGEVREEIHFLASNGIRGIKLHPEYQRFYPDDPRLFDIYWACREYGLVIAFHAGFDFPYPDQIRAVPERLKEVTKIDGLKLIFAHLGGYQMWDDVLKHLVGTSAYFDTAFISTIKTSELLEVVRRHGGDKILFGSDFPWARASEIRKIIEGAFENREIRDGIFHKNAEKLLGVVEPIGKGEET